MNQQTLDQLLGRKQTNAQKKVVISQAVINAMQQNKDEKGSLFGRILPEEDLIQVLSFERHLKGMPLNDVGEWNKKSASSEGLSIVIKEDGFLCFENGQEIKSEVFDIGDYHIRNRSEVMSQKIRGKRVFVISDGSVMSRSIYELLKHGIEVTVTDPDRLSIHNPYRWGMQEVPELLVGRYKPLVSKELAEQNIPGVKITAFTKDFCKEISFFDQYIDEWKPELIIIATDTEDSRRDANSIGYNKQIPVMYVGLSDKAESGQIMLISGKKENPCYSCFSGNKNPFKGRATNKQYGIDSENEVRAVPALSIDINIITDIATKIAVAVLAGEDGYFKKFDNRGEVMWFSTKPDTWVFEDFAQKIIAKIEKNPDCRVCGNQGEKP